MIRNYICQESLMDNIDHYNKGFLDEEKSVLNLCKYITDNMCLIEAYVNCQNKREILAKFAERIKKELPVNKEACKIAGSINFYVNDFFFKFEDPIKYILSFLFSKTISKDNPFCGLEITSLISTSFNRYSQDFKKEWVERNFFPLDIIYRLKTADKVIECIEKNNFRKINLSGISDFKKMHLKKLSKLNIISLKIFFDCKCPKMESLKELVCDGIVNDECLDNIVNACPNLTLLELGLGSITDKSMAKLKSFSKLNKINLQSCNITDVGMDELKSFSNLTEINITNTFITFKGLLKVAKINQNLTHFHYFKSQISDEDVSDLAKYCPNLVSINLPKAKMTSKSLKEVAKACYSLEFLNFDASYITDEDLIEFSINCPTIKELTLLFALKITIKGILSFLEASINLKKIYINKNITFEQSIILKIAHPNIEITIKI